MAHSQSRSSVSRSAVLGFRVRTQQLDRDPGAGRLADTAVLDFGVQDPGPAGGRWALAIRGVDLVAVPDDQLVLLWTLRGAPHLYRRADLPAVRAAVEPFSDGDAGRRIVDAAKPLKAAGIGYLTALDTVAAAMRSIVTGPMVKGEVSTRLTGLLDQPYLRFCRPCQATHAYEQTFRLGALRAGLELEPGTSPPVLRPSPDPPPAGPESPRHDLIRCYLHLLGPATPKHVADFLDAPVREVRERWPTDAVAVVVEGEQRWLLAADQELAAAPPTTTRLLGPSDLFLQAKDRPLLVDDPSRAKALWPVLGRPGAVLVDGEIAGPWRPRQSGKKLTVRVEPWRPPSKATRAAIAEQAERLAAHRGVTLAAVDLV